MLNLWMSCKMPTVRRSARLHLGAGRTFGADLPTIKLIQKDSAQPRQVTGQEEGQKKSPSQRLVRRRREPLVRGFCSAFFPRSQSSLEWHWCIMHWSRTPTRIGERNHTTAAQGTSDTTALSSHPFLVHLPTPTYM